MPSTSKAGSNLLSFSECGLECLGPFRIRIIRSASTCRLVRLIRWFRICSEELLRVSRLFRRFRSRLYRSGMSWRSERMWTRRERIERIVTNQYYYINMVLFLLSILFSGVLGLHNKMTVPLKDGARTIYLNKFGIGIGEARIEFKMRLTKGPKLHDGTGYNL